MWCGEHLHGNEDEGYGQWDEWQKVEREKVVGACEGLEREMVVMGMWIFKETICMDGQDGWERM